MSYKCRICCVNDVDNPDDICELCKSTQDPYVSAYGGTNAAQGYNDAVSVSATDTAQSYVPGKSRSRKILIGDNDKSDTASVSFERNRRMPLVQSDNTEVKVYQSGQAPEVQSVQNSSNTSAKADKTSNANIDKYITTGISKNITTDTQDRAVIVKWFRSFFGGAPFSLSNEITMFQVFPDYSGTSLNALGNACDQVIVYGKLKMGAVSENNEVEVYGNRDKDNNVVASKIKNKASGTIIKPEGSISAAVVRILTALFFLAIMGFVYTYGAIGVVWTVVIILCLTNAPLVIKIIGVILGMIFSFFKRLF